MVFRMGSRSRTSKRPTASSRPCAANWMAMTKWKHERNSTGFACCRSRARGLAGAGYLSRAFVQQRLEIRPCALRFALGGFGGLTEAEIAVDEAEAVVIAGRHAGRGKRVGVGLALVAERIEPG